MRSAMKSEWTTVTAFGSADQALEALQSLEEAKIKGRILRDGTRHRPSPSLGSPPRLSVGTPCKSTLRISTTLRPFSRQIVKDDADADAARAIRSTIA